MTGLALLTVDVRQEEDVVAVRQRARQIAGQIGFSPPDQTGFTTAVSEIVRNAYRYAGGGRVEFALALASRPQTLVVRVIDRGPGIAEIDAVRDGRYVSKTGMGLGIVGSQRLCDVFEIRTAPDTGTVVTLGKHLPRRAAPLDTEAVRGVIDDLARRVPRNALEEVQDQNRDLLQTMDALRVRQAEVERLNAELAETNRGVVALYAELDDRAESLRLASEYKSRFLSDMTHELRTPLNAVISLSCLLLDRADGDLTPEQEKQVSFIHRAASSLGDMVNDLLDLAKIEAGKTDVHVAPFALADALAAVRGSFRPLLIGAIVPLIVEEPPVALTLCGDERKLTQVLRNLVSNALKFTEAGEVRVSSESLAGEQVRLSVADTGIGIGPDDLDRVFEDFTQIDSRVQRRVRGTGLGLPLARKLTRLMGGDIEVHSALGVGTTFVVTLPVQCPTPARAAAAERGVPA